MLVSYSSYKEWSFAIVYTFHILFLILAEYLFHIYADE